MNYFEKKVKNIRWGLLSEKKRQRLMQVVLDLLQQDQDTAALLTMAQADHIKISFSRDLIESKTNGILTIDYKNNQWYIALSPVEKNGRLRSPLNIAGTLVHELRHYWQFKKMGITCAASKHASSPRLSFIFNRVMEADAYAFEERFFQVADKIRRDLYEEKKKDLAPEQQNVHQQLALLRLKDKQFLRDHFLDNLKDISNRYDPDEAFELYMLHVEQQKRVDPSQYVLTLKNMRKLLKAGVTDDARGYFDDLTDRQFEALVLRHAHHKARGVVYLIEKFKQAMAANDNKKAARLRDRVCEKVKQFKKIKI